MTVGQRIKTLLYTLDGALVLFATLIAYFVRFEGHIPSYFSRYLLPVVIASTLSYLIAFSLLGIYRAVLRFVGIETALRIAVATALGSVPLIIAAIAVPVETGMRLVPFGVLFIQALLVFLFASGLRLSSRIRSYLGENPLRKAGTGRKALIVGAGSAGSLLLHDIESNSSFGFDVVGFLDDDASLKGRTIRSIPVVGSTSQLAQIAAELNVSEVLFALPSAPKEKVRKLLNSAADAKLTTRIVPPLVITKGSVETQDLRRVEVEDLLGREETPIDTEQVRSTIQGKVVAVTGAAGSIGSELCRQIMKLNPSTLLLIENDESRLYELWLELGGDSSCAIMCLCDITHKEKLTRLLVAHHPDLVLHAAAYKHVPLMELAPEEAVRVNVGGTATVLQACEDAGVKRFVLISTDKAVAPTSVMGATKALAEILARQACEQGSLEAVSVRFGNVLGSRGSVVPLFEEQLRRGGPILITNEEMTRYFMTIPEASRLVLQAQAIGNPGDTFVLEMGEPVKITDLAQKMIALSGIPAEIKVIGLRPAEKLHEVLSYGDEHLTATTAQRILKLELPAGKEPTAVQSIDIKNLLEAASLQNTDDIRSILQGMLPTYTPYA